MFWNEVINNSIVIVALCSFAYAIIKSLDSNPLYGDNDLDNDVAHNERKKAQRLYKAQKKALKAATKRA